MSASTAITLALTVARSILSGEIEPYRGAAEIWRQVAEAGRIDIAELAPFIGLASEWQDHSDLRREIEQDIQAVARAFVARHSDP